MPVLHSTILASWVSDHEEELTALGTFLQLVSRAEGPDPQIGEGDDEQ